MSFSDVGTLVGMVINELSQVPGVVTQKYSSPVITQYIQNAYMMEIEDVWWPDYMHYFQNVNVDPLTGLLTSDLIGPISSIDDYGDIQAVWPGNSSTPLMGLPSSMNPATFTTNSSAGGTSMPVYIAPDQTLPNRPFRVYPTNSIGPLVVLARQSTAIPFTTGTRVGIDPLLLMFDAAWQYCISDGTIPAQVAKYELLIKKRRQQMITNFNNMPIPLDKRIPVDPLASDPGSQFFIPVLLP